MTLKQLKKKYLIEGFKRGYKKALRENAFDASKMFDYLLDSLETAYNLEEGYGYSYGKYERPTSKDDIESISKVWVRYCLDDFLETFGYYYPSFGYGDIFRGALTRFADEHNIQYSDWAIEFAADYMISSVFRKADER